ncbi:hypothetical protein BJ878DRAFT_93905 [Calycina marina]|uniref:Mediator complex subunit 15 KIX domain-containing protein n=1 Tax=Calycina marina TaxID=1763456 RepID=A0A9P8CIQ5_9HELO|nr:hypothetical protein BJ878DRAFT_93905 [Calycina marina]
MAGNFQQQQQAQMNAIVMQQQQQQHPQAQRAQQPQQRPQQQGQSLNGGMTAQLQSKIIGALKDQTGPLAGWQATVMINERLTYVLKIVGNLRLASQATGRSLTISDLVEMSLKSEKEIFEGSADKDHYKHQIEQKQSLLLEKRNGAAQNMQQSIADQARASAQAQHAAIQQQLMNPNMNPNMMQGQVPRSQGFQHLQHQMTASPIPGQGNQQINGGMPNLGMPPNMTPNQQQHFQMSMQQQGQQPGGQQLQNGMGTSQNGPGNPAELMIQNLAKRMMDGAPPEQNNKLRQRVNDTVDAAILQQYAANGLDSVLIAYRHEAFKHFREQNQARQLQAAQQQQSQMAMNQQQAQNIPVTAPPMQQQRSMNSGLAQPPTTGSGKTEFFAGNMIDQQQQGVMAEQQGQTVLPISSAPRNATPQPGLMAGQQMKFNDQRVIGNQTFPPQHRQHLVNMQQQRAQQQTSAATLAQQQQAMRAAPQANMSGLNGQPGGMGPGTVPPNLGSAMPSLNAPLTRPPSQMNQSAEAPMNPNMQFGQTTDPRFTQANQRSQMQASIIAGMPPGIQNRILALPQEKVSEAISKWQMRQRNPQLGPSGQNGMGPANNQLRQGPQNPQQGQFNPQNALSQPVMTNPGRPPQPHLANGLSAQQQILLQQQMNRMNQNPRLLQQRNVNQAPMSPQQMNQMDGWDIPPLALGHHSMPRNIPPEIKKWGSLRNWIQQSAGMPPDSLEVVSSLQRLHFNQVMRQRQQTSGGMQPGGPSPASNMAIGNPAPASGSNGLPPGMQPVTASDIQNARNNNSHLATVADDQIRNHMIRTRMQQWHQQRQAMSQEQLQSQLKRMQQSRPGMPGQMPQPPNNGQMQQPRPQPQQSVDPAAGRANKLVPGGRGNAAHSSPIEPSNKSLKRQSSEDVVEVPNPSSQQPQRTPQQSQVLKASGPSAQTPQQQQVVDRLRQFGREETEAARTTSMPDIPMDQATKTKTHAAIFAAVVMISKARSRLLAWYSLTQDDTRAKYFFRSQYRLSRQFKDKEMKYIHENLSMNFEEAESIEISANSMVADFESAASQNKSCQNASHPDAAATQTSPQPGPSSGLLLNAENLQRVQSQINMQKVPNRGSTTPAAPTSSAPPFQFGGPSPHGAPAYGNGKQLSVADLKIPARKRVKTNPSESTPGAISSPIINKNVSPEFNRANMPQPKQQAKPIFNCTDRDCERLEVGFENAQALEEHNQEEHIKPKADPAKYTLGGLSDALGLDFQGKPKVAAGEATAQTNSRQVQTPHIKSGTPMSRRNSMARQGSSTGKSSKLGDLSKRQDTPQEAGGGNPWANTIVDQQDLVSTFKHLESMVGGGISDMNVYRSITPNESPESNATATTETSDISDGVALDINLNFDFDDNWQPFRGSESCGVADLNNFDFGSDNVMLQQDEEPMGCYMTWGDAQQDFSNPIVFDGSMHDMNPGQ